MNAQTTLSIDELTAQPLPIFGHSARAFQQFQSTGSTDFKAFGDIILKDPALTLHTLQQIQPPPGKPPRTDISSMSQAAMMLGAERAQQLTNGQPLFENSLSGLAQAGYARAACRAFHAAFQAWDWAHIKNDHDPDEIFLAALLHDVTEMALWVVAPERIHQLRKLIFKDRLHTDEAQYLALGESLEHFSREIAFRWHLPPLVHEALRPENASNVRVQGVMLAVQLGRAAERGWHTEKMQRTLQLIADHLGKSLDETTSHIQYNAVRAAREANFYGARPAAAMLPLLPGGDEILLNDEFPEAESKSHVAPKTSATIETNSPATTAHVTEDLSEPASVTSICLMPQPKIFAQTVKKLQAGMGSMELNDIMRSTVHGLHDGVGLNRVVFCMLSPERSKLISRFIMGADNDPSFSRFEVDVDKPSLFTRVLEKPVSLWINDENRAKLWKLVPDEFQVLIKTNTFYVTSIHIDEKPIGLFYADRRGPECQLDDHSYKQFRQLCQLANKALASSSEKI